MTNRDSVTDLVNRTKAIVETIVDGVITIDHRGLIDTVNPAAEKIFGYQSSELIGRNVNILMPAPYREEHDSYVHNYLRTGDKKIIGIGREVRGLRKGGQSFPIELAISEMVVNDQRMFTGVVRDISERKETEKKLRDAMRRVDEQRIKDEFIATVSHELRTPLTSIKASLEIMRAKGNEHSKERTETLLDIAYRNSERLLLLINDILDISKIESQKMNYRMQRIALKAFLKSALEVNRSYGDKHKVRFLLSNCPADRHIDVDPDRMMQVMSNLLSNAAKFSPEGGEIHVSAEPKDQRVSICVKDWGRGIPLDIQPRIFDKFTQEDSSDRRQLGGTGLGLYISQAIVKQHGGTLSFSSTPGEGSEFYIDLFDRDQKGDRDG